MQMKQVFSIIVFLILTATFAKAQSVDNIRFEQSGKQVVIYYDLLGEQGTIWNIEIYCSQDEGTTWGSHLQKLSGEFGNAIMPGTNKQVIWEMLDELDKIEGEISFKVEASSKDITETVAGLNMKMTFIKGGNFQMGSNDGESAEKPLHNVTVSDFYMGKMEVTLAQFKAFIDATLYTTDAEKDGGSYVWIGSKYKIKSGVNWLFNGKGSMRSIKEYNHPVNNVSWKDATAFCEWLKKKTGKTYRLPTEAEWEYACRAGTTTPFNTGNNLTTSQANYDGNYSYKNNAKGIYRKRTISVGSFTPNTWGLYDMHGNVWEWCSDLNGKYDYDNESQTNPIGASYGSFRVLRGGCWNNSALRCRVTERGAEMPGLCSDGIGFRLVLSSK